jgi:polar amino acid transport system permease protein
MHYHLQFDILDIYLSTLISGLWVTLVLSALGVVLGFMIGVLGAIAAVSRYHLARWLALGYVEVFRNTPLLVQLLIIYFGLPVMGVRLSPVVAASVALVLNNAAYITEIVRAGIKVTPRGQYEAAEALGMTRVDVLRYVVLPPALTKVFAPVVSQSVLLMLSTSVVSAVGVQELTGAAMLVSSNTFRALEIYLSISAAYVALNFAFSIALGALLGVVSPRSRSGFLWSRKNA